MQDLITFLKDILMINSKESKVGLSQFKDSPTPPQIVRHNPKEVRLSDLMRKSA